MVVCVICTVIAQRFLYSLLYYNVLRLSSSPQTVLIPNIFTRQYISLHGYPLCNLDKVFKLLVRLFLSAKWLDSSRISFYVILSDREVTLPNLSYNIKG